MSVFDKRRKELGITVGEAKASSSSGESAFDRRRKELQQQREQVRQDSIKQAETRKTESNNTGKVESNSAGKKLLSTLTPGLDALKNPKKDEKKTSPRLDMKIDPLKTLMDANAQTQGNYGVDRNYQSEPFIIRDIHKALDKFGDFVRPATDFAEESGLVPGNGVPGGNAIGQGIKFGASKLLGSSLAARLASSVSGAAGEGAITGGAATLSATGNEREALKGALLGSGIGGVPVGVGLLTKAGLQKGADVIGGKLANTLGALDSVGKSELPQTVSRGSDVRIRGLKTADQGITAAADQGAVKGAQNVTEQAAERVPSKFGARRAELGIAQSPEPPVKPEPATQQGERAYLRTLEKSGRLNEDVSAGLQQSANRSYDQITNAGTLEKVNSMIEQDATRVESELLNKTGKYTAEDVTAGIRTIQELQKSGNVERAVTIAENLSKALTEAGQAIQAASIVNRLSPDGQFLYLVRRATAAGKAVTPQDAKVYTELAAVAQKGSTSKVETSEFMTVLNRLKSGEKVSPEELKQAKSILNEAQKYLKPPKETPPLNAELKEIRKRDQVLSFLEKQAEEARKAWAAKRNIGFAQKLSEPDIILLAKMATYEVAKQAVKLADFTEYAVKEFGEMVRPYAEEIYNRAVKMVNSTSKHISEDKLDKAHEAFKKLSGQAAAEKQVVSSMAAVVKKVMNDVKKDGVDPQDLATIKELSEEIANFETPRRVTTDEQRFLQTVKSLAKKLADVEQEKVTTTEANREVSSLLRQVSKLTDPGEKLTTTKIDNESMKNLAYDLMEMQRPDPKPKTVYEKVAEKFISQGTIREGDVEALRDLAKQLNDLVGADAQKADMQMQEILNKYTKSTAWEKVQTIRYISMLLNSATQSVNAISGPMMATTGYVADVFGTMIDVALNKILKTQRTTTLYGSNPLRFIAGWFKNAGVGAKAGAKGVNPGGITGQHDIRGLTFKSLYNPLGLAERGLGAVSKGADYGTYKTVYDSELQKLAFLDAKNKRIKGKDAIKAHMEKFLLDPPIEAIEQADKIGKGTTFQRHDTLGGKLANYANSAPGVAKPFIGAVFPFIRTPVNIASQAVTLTPGGIIKGLYQLTKYSDASQRDAIRTLSLGLTGTGLSALGYYLSNLGIITGANDSGNKNVDAIKEQAGQGKYRFNTSALGRYLSAMLNGEGAEAAEKAAKYQEGDKQFDYNKLQPLAFPLAIGAGVNESRGETAGKATEKVLMDSYGSLFGMSTLRGVQDVFQPSYQGTVGEKALGVPMRIAESFIKSFSPSFLAQEARRQDPIVRKTSFNNGLMPDVKDYFKSRTPGLSQSLPPSLTTLGLTKQNAPGIKGQYLNPFKSEKAAYSEAAKIISDLIDRTGEEKLAPTAPDKKVSGKAKTGGQHVEIDIPPKRYEQMQQEQGAEIIKRILALPTSLSDADKTERILKIYEDVRAEQRNKVKAELGIQVK